VTMHHLSTDKIRGYNKNNQLQDDSD